MARINKPKTEITPEHVILIGPDDIAVKTEVNYDLVLADRISDKFRSEVDWIERLVSHAPTIGEHYEQLLISLLRERLGTDHGIGRGFVLNSERQSSSQLDLIVYRESSQRPIYQRDDFVIVDSDSVSAVGEVKKTLTKAELRSLCRKFLPQSLGTRRHWPAGCQRLHVFAIRALMKSEVILEVLREEFSRFSDSLLVKGSEADRSVIHALCLPSFYFFDRDELIETRLEKGKGLNFHLLSGISKSHASKDSLSNLVADLITGSLHRGFLQTSVRNVSFQAATTAKVGFGRRYSAAQLAAKFPSEKQMLRSDEESCLLGVIVAADVELDDFDSLQDFLSIRPLGWESFKRTGLESKTTS